MRIYEYTKFKKFGRVVTRSRHCEAPKTHQSMSSTGCTPGETAVMRIFRNAMLNRVHQTLVLHVNVCKKNTFPLRLDYYMLTVPLNSADAVTLFANLCACPSFSDSSAGTCSGYGLLQYLVFGDNAETFSEVANFSLPRGNLDDPTNFKRCMTKVGEFEDDLVVTIRTL
jgi:hypothetical protein